MGLGFPVWFLLAVLFFGVWVHTDVGWTWFAATKDLLVAAALASHLAIAYMKRAR